MQKKKKTMDILQMWQRCR